MIRDLWLRVGGPNAVSFLVWIAMSPIAVLGLYFAYVRDVPQGAEGLLFFISLTAYLPYGAILGLAWLTYLSPRITRRPRPKLAIGTFLLAGFSTGITFAALIDGTGLQDSPDYLGLAITRALIALYWASLLALVMDSHRRFTTKSAELVDAIQVAVDISKTRIAILDALRIELIEKVRSTINVALNVKVRADLDLAADQIVRPLVDALRSKGAVLPEQNSHIFNKINIKPILFESLARPSAPYAVSLLATVANLVASVRWLAPATFANLLIVGALIAATLVLVKRVRPGKAALILIFSVGVALSIASGEVFQQFAPENARELANLNVGSWMVAIFIGSFVRFEHKRAEVLQQLEATLQEIQWNKERLQQEMWVERNRLMRYVHGNIQSKIRAAASRSGNLTTEQLEDLKEDCLQMLDFEVSPMSFEDFLQQTQRVWDGILEIKSDADPMVLSLLGKDSFSNAALIETVREGVLNAVRHGNARRVYCKIRLIEAPQGRTLSLELKNDGDPVDPKSDSGFGSTVLDDSTASWKLENFPGGVVLKAEIPASLGSQVVLSSAQ